MPVNSTKSFVGADGYAFPDAPTDGIYHKSTNTTSVTAGGTDYDFSPSTATFTNLTVTGTFVGPGGGGVTDVGMTVPPFLSVTPANITTTGTFAVTLASAGASQVLIGPASGSATPTQRLLAVGDLPVNPSVLMQLAVPEVQISGTVSGLTAGMNAGTTSIVTYEPNEVLVYMPFAGAIAGISVHTYGGNATAGSLTATLNGLSSGAVSITLGTGANAVNTYTPFSSAPQYAVNAVLSVTVSSTGWNQTSDGGVNITIWKY